MKARIETQNVKVLSLRVHLRLVLALRHHRQRTRDYLAQLIPPLRLSLLLHHPLQQAATAYLLACRRRGPQVPPHFHRETDRETLRLRLQRLWQIHLLALILCCLPTRTHANRAIRHLKETVSVTETGRLRPPRPTPVRDSTPTG